ncbi:MAG: 23S rRNA (uracil(1939)-C(5))-methyltransferase RlmD [Actinomycetia bacterium]|nr:23S rRNA (uracil(1939)-C(5))-methyltransferase RlmD [Actinomycetes bacterium]
MQISALAFSGPGLGHLADGRVIFVPGALPGERVTVEVVASKPRYLRGQLLQVDSPAAERILPVCAQSDDCGGCPWQHLAYPTQLRWKRQFVVDALQRVGHCSQAEELVRPMRPAPQIWSYRNKLELDILDLAGRLELCMYAPNSLSPVSIQHCHLLPDFLAERLPQLAGLLNFALGREPAPPYRLGLRYSQRTQQLELALWSQPGPLRRAWLAARLQELLPVSSLVRVLTAPEQTASRRVQKTEVLAGRGFWSEILDGRRLKVSAPAFFQVNTVMAEQLVQQVVTQLAPAGQTVWDLYSGVGTFSLALAAAGARVQAVELSGYGIRDCQRNSRELGLADQLTITAGDVARVIPSLPAAQSIVVDPPRAGLTPAVTQALCDQRPANRLLYVSCDPQTLARDGARLAAGGWVLQSAQPFDLFPQSYHVETIADFYRPTPPAP